MISLEMKINGFQHLCKQSLIRVCTLARELIKYLCEKNLKFKSPFFTISPFFRKIKISPFFHHFPPYQQHILDI